MHIIECTSVPAYGTCERGNAGKMKHLRRPNTGYASVLRTFVDNGWSAGEIIYSDDHPAVTIVSGLNAALRETKRHGCKVVVRGDRVFLTLSDAPSTHVGARLYVDTLWAFDASGQRSWTLDPPEGVTVAAAYRSLHYHRGRSGKGHIKVTRTGESITLINTAVSEG